MKAYKAYDSNNDDGCSTIVFAENAKKAKRIAMSTDACEYAKYIDIRVNRIPEADKLYRGRDEIDWYDMNDRIALVRDFGWACYETSWECNGCPANQWCRHFEKESEADNEQREEKDDAEIH